jgi:hypothetical protein
LERFHLKLAVLGVSSVFSFNVMGWGERGHHVICAVATRLVESRELANFLKSREHLAGHVCNIPDIHWKDLEPSTKLIDASHHINPENLGYKIDEVPTSLKQIREEKSKTGEEVGLQLGTLWWRADQFYRRAVEGAKHAKASDFPQKGQSQDMDQPYNHGIYEFLVNISLMGHFVGDASVPFHNTRDYDGWEKGKGGIHAYYESMSVEAMGLDLENQVYQRALTAKNRGKGNSENSASVLETLKELSTAASQELAKVDELDVVSSPSDKDSKTFAKRPPASKGAEAFGDLIVGEMARSSLALARLWSQAWEQGGSVSFKGYRSYKYPLAPELVTLDYLEN